MGWDNWGHGAGTWGGFIGDRRWNETFGVPLGDARVGHGVGLGDKWGHGLGHGVGLGLGDTGLGHGVGLGDKWGHGAGTRSGFRGPAWWIT